MALLFLYPVLGPGFAEAQDVASMPELVVELTEAPRLGQYGVALTIGGSYKSGRTNTAGVTLKGYGAHTTDKGELLRLDLRVKFGEYAPTEDAPRTTVEDNQRVRFTYMKPINKRLSALGAAVARRDTLIGLDYRAFVEGGLGLALVENKKVFLQVGGSFGLGKESRTHTSRASDVVDIGALQLFTWKLGPALGIEQYFVMHHDVTDTTDRSAVFSVTLHGQVSKHVGLKIYYDQQYDALRPPGTPADQRELGAGIQIDFKPKKANARSKP